MLLRLINYIKGYYAIEVRGPFFEKFINLCTKSQIYLWDAKRAGNALRLKVSAKGYGMLDEIAEKTGCQINVMDKCGLYVMLHRYRKRTAFFIGIFLCFIFLAVLSSFIWAIEIEGNEKVTKEEILLALDSCGLRQGVLKYKIRPKKLQNDALMKLDKVAWLWVDIKGTVAYVQIKEKAEKPEIVGSIPCNVIAAKTGVIESINVLSGQKMVNVGDTVWQGQLLVSGIINSEAVGMRIVSARAEVTARIWYEREVLEPLTVETKTPTGRKKTYYSIGIFGHTVGLPKRITYETYEKTDSFGQLRLWKDFYIPVSIYKEEFVEIIKGNETITVQQVEEKNKQALLEELEGLKINSVTVKSENVDEKTVKVTMVAETSERIDLQQPLP